MSELSVLRKRLASNKKKKDAAWEKHLKLQLECSKICKRIFDITVIEKYGKTFKYRSKNYEIQRNCIVREIYKSGKKSWEKRAFYLSDFLAGKSGSPFNQTSVNKKGTK